MIVFAGMCVILALSIRFATAAEDLLMEAFKESMGAEYDEAVARIKAEETTCGVLDGSSLIKQCGLEFFHMVDVNECLEKKAAESEKALKDAEKTAIDRLGQWDESDEYIKLAKKAIRVSGKTFLQYRKDHCALATSMLGLARGVVIDRQRNACVAELNNRRAKQLRDFIDTIHLR
jgi:uncharacterized protein YecT (DUF1311 family)